MMDDRVGLGVGVESAEMGFCRCLFLYVGIFDWDRFVLFIFLNNTVIYFLNITYLYSTS